jgi:hypothetical protein
LSTFSLRYAQGRIVIGDVVAIGIQIGNAAGNTDDSNDPAIL